LERLAFDCGRRANRKTLRAWWDINDCAELRQTTDWLKTQGHSRLFDAGRRSSRIATDPAGNLYAGNDPPGGGRQDKRQHHHSSREGHVIDAIGRIGVADKRRLSRRRLDHRGPLTRRSP